MRGIEGRKNLTSRQAARLLGASEASVKRWADGGLLPAVRTAGGHRRFRPEDVAAFGRGRVESGAARVSGVLEVARPEAGGETAPEGGALDEDLSRLMFETLLAGYAESA